MNNKWKKILIAILIMPIVVIASSCSCIKGDDHIEVYTVSFYSGTPTSLYDELQVNEGSKIQEPAEPVLEGYIFLGWYKENTCTTKWNFQVDTITMDTKIWAKWERAENINPSTPPTT